MLEKKEKKKNREKPSAAENENPKKLYFTSQKNSDVRVPHFSWF